MLILMHMAKQAHARTQTMTSVRTQVHAMMQLRLQRGSTAGIWVLAVGRAGSRDAMGEDCASIIDTLRPPMACDT